MDILTANQDTTTRFAVTIEEINSKYKKKKEDLKRLIAKTAISQAQQILAELSNDNISNPEQLCKKITCILNMIQYVLPAEREARLDLLRKLENFIFQVWSCEPDFRG